MFPIQKRSLFFCHLFIVYSCVELNSMTHKSYHSIIVPGQNGIGGEDYVYQNVINTKNFTSLPILLDSTRSTDKLKIDLGQGNCINDFQKKLENINIPNDTNLLLYGASQGTAVLINWLAQQPQDVQNRVKCLHLEAVLRSGNSAIVHTTEHMISSKITYLPFARLWLPWAAKALFPTYNPLGKQVYKSAKKLSKDLPVIIMHDVNDPQLSINDARALYCDLLQDRSEKNVYLFETSSNVQAHVNILENDVNRHMKIAALQKIYEQHNLPFNHEAKSKHPYITPETFQPSIEQVQKNMYESTWKKRYLRNTIDIVTGATLLSYVAYRYKNS